MKESIKLLSLFSGCGCTEIGLQQALGGRLEIVGFSEIDKHANMVLKYRFPEVKNYGDIEQIKADILPNFNLLTFGFPCQDISIAGGKEGLSGERSGLFFHALRLLREKQPLYFIAENVGNIISINNGLDLARVCFELAQAGYNIQWQILNADDFGIAQSRKRIFIIGYHRSIGARKVLPITTEKQTTTRAVGSRILSCATPDLINKKQFGSRFKKDKMFTITSVFVHGIVLSKEKIQIRDKACCLDASYYHGITNNQNRTGVLDGGRIRRLTPLETERIMGLPDNWTKWGIDENDNKIEISDKERYKMCGNGLVPEIIKVVADRMFINELKEIEKKQKTLF